MKILYVITKSNWGGAQRHVYDLAVAMKEAGHEVMVALGGEGLLRTRLESVGIFTHSIAPLGRDISLGKEAGSLKEILSIVRSKKPDILHLHSPKAAGLGALAGRVLGIKSILYTVHGWPFNEDRSLYQKTLIALFSWLTMILSHQVILLSEREYSQATHFPWVKKKLRLLPLGIRPPIFMSIDGAKQVISKKIGEDISKKIVVGTIAELHPNKGLPYLIDAMEIVCRDHPNVICIIIGDGQEMASLHLEIIKHKLEQKIFLVGYMENASEYLKAFTIFVLPSLKEGLPYTILEAGCASLPVVSTTVGGIPEIVEDMKSGILIQPKKPRELAHAISFLIEQSDERRKYGTALRLRMLTQFSLEKMLSGIEKLYTNSDSAAPYTLPLAASAESSTVPNESLASVPPTVAQ